jgi:phytoene synthase
LSGRDLLAVGYEQARKINAVHGKSYYWATQLLPTHKRKATHALYAFFRLADDIVDNPETLTKQGHCEAKVAFDKFEEEWITGLSSGECSNPALYAAISTMHDFKIPQQYSFDFLNAMRMDLLKNRYYTFDDLSNYMYGSAACVGLMMSYILGFKEESQLMQLSNLGVAMQLTNFLRDIDEDYHSYGRIYIPLEDLDQFNLSETDIAERRFTNSWKMMMEFEADRAEILYRNSSLVIGNLDRDGQFPVRLASVLYSAILGKLREQNWNVFAGRASTSAFEKFMLTLKTFKLSYE